MTEEPFGYDTDGDGYIDTEDRGSFFGYDFDGDGDIDADGDFYGFMMAEEGDFCFIATAVYGDLNHPKVITLRRFRDRVLTKNSLGRAVIRLYYHLGPSLAAVISRNNRLKTAVKSVLEQMTLILQGN
jgi:hypothetical protein